MEKVEQINIESKIWIDDRGWVNDLLSAIGISFKSIGDFHIVSIKPGKTRGNHFHKNATEWILFLGGKATLIWRKVGEKLVNKIEVAGNAPTLYKISRNIEHTVINNDQCDIYLIGISDNENRGTVKSAKLI
jgi:UDP-2-acetamido-2,6-beta-L-arabino-hexul-4-ose reductase